ncbi:MAG: hypothetical protein MJZ84_05205 [Paludibacteraceae bacterium]|nr:hypothetical protein [Paludibacteraceae bacterium]
MSANKLTTAQEYVRSNYVETGRLRYDLLSQKLQVAPQPPKGGVGRLEDGAELLQDGASTYRLEARVWTDLDTRWINTLAVECANETGVNVTDKEIRIVLNSHVVPAINPLRNWLLSLPEYIPGNSSFIDWLSSQVKIKESFSPQGGLTANAESGLSAARLSPTNGENQLTERGTAHAVWQHCFKKWFVAMVASWLYDDVVNQQVLVLIGKQGIYKTTWLEHLLPPCLRAYCTKMANVRDLNKDERMRIAEFGLINLDEIDSMSDKELNQLKSIITSSDVNERAAYGYTKERRIRIASFCASGNKREFLTDQTGNRRWLPFEVESIESPYLYGDVFPYEQIYGEALYLLRNGFEYWFELEEIEAMESHVESFHVESNEEQLLPVYFQPANPGDAGAVFMTAAEISSYLTNWGNIKKPLALNKLSTILRKSGYTLKRTHSKKGFVVFLRQDIDNQRKIEAKEAFDASDATDAYDIF